MRLEQVKLPYGLPLEWCAELPCKGLDSGYIRLLAAQVTESF